MRAADISPFLAPLDDPRLKKLDINQTADDRIEKECTAFLYREAELLDAWELHAWLKLLTPDIDYRIPVRTTRMKKDGDGIRKRAFILEEDMGSLTLRVKRLDSDYAWSENPRSRTRRMVANIRVSPCAAEGETAGAKLWQVRSNVAVYIHRGDEAQPVVLTGERQDQLQQSGATWLLHKRLVLLDTTVLGMDAFSIFI